MNCQHKKEKIRCMIYTNCCDHYYQCVKCHNENENHTIKLSDIVNIKCLDCEKTQQISEKCSNEKCQICFSQYFCAKCKIFSNETIFHCDQCNACIGGLKYKYKHCKICDCCIEKRKYNLHICIENRLLDNCPICIESLKSNLQVVILKCGHSIHQICKKTLCNTNFLKCPICKTSIIL